MSDLIRILQGDCRETLKTLPDRSVQCCVTSPPYHGLRNYQTGKWEGGDPACDHLKDTQHQKQGATSQRAGRSNVEARRNETFSGVCGKCGAVRVDRQIGLENSPEEYVSALVMVFREVKRVLRDDGVLWINLGDSYARQAGDDSTRGTPNTGQKRSMDAGADMSGSGNHKPPTGMKQKDLGMIPARVALALQADGWYLRSQIPWCKRNCMPESCADRPTSAVEYVYLLTKSADYYYDKKAVAIPSTMLDEVEQGYDGLGIKDYESAGVQNPSSVKARIIANARKKIYAQGTSESGTSIPGHSGNYKANGEPMFGLTRNRRNSDWFFESWQGLWDEGGGPMAFVVNTVSYRESHFATYPPALVKPCVLAGTSAAGCCPKCGAPYLRETEDCGVIRVREGSNTGAADGQETDVGHLGANSIFKTGEKPLTKTTGWKPGCACAAGKPVPCTVLDPFGGSGTTAQVAVELGRAAVLCELNADYIELINRRCDVTPGLPL